MMGRNIKITVVLLIILAFSGQAAGDILLNGTRIYLSSGEPYGLFQGYILTLKSVSGEGSVWLELRLNDSIVKSDIVHVKDFFIYNKTNKTILSVKVDTIYSGSRDRNLVSLFPLYQYADPDLPTPEITEIAPSGTETEENHSAPPGKETLQEPVIWVAGIIAVIILFYIVYRLW